MNLVKSNKKTVLVTFALLGWMLDFFDLILYSFLLFWIQADFNLTNTQLAFVYSCSLAITAVGGVALGFVGDRIGRRPTIILSVFIFSLGTLLSGFAWNLESLLIFRLITGFGIGGEWAAGHTLINESLPHGEKGKASAIIQSGAPLGTALASIVGAFLSPVIGWRASFILGSVPSFILVVFMYKYLPESPQFAIFKSEAQFDQPDRSIPKGSSYIRMTTNRSLQDLWQVRSTLLLGTFLSLWGMLAYWVIFSFAPKYLKDIGYSDSQTGWWMLLSQLGAFIGYLSFGFVADFTGKFRVTYALYAINFALGVSLFSSGAYYGNAAMGFAGIFITGLGTGFFSGYGPLYSRLFPTKIRNTCSSWCFNIGRLGAFVAPLMVTSLATVFGFAGAFLIAAGFAIIAATWVFLLPEKVSQPHVPISTKHLSKSIT